MAGRWGDWAGLTLGSSSSGLRELGKALPLLGADQIPAAKISIAGPGWAAADQLWARQRWAHGWGLTQWQEHQESQGSKGLLHPALAPFCEHTVEESCQSFFLSSHAWRKKHPQTNLWLCQTKVSLNHGKKGESPCPPQLCSCCTSSSSLSFSPNEVTPQI